jgi:hypothetical protein
LCAAADPPLPQQKVRRAIEKARDWLLKEQRTNGTWECATRTNDTRVGATALVMLALANSGVEAEHPAMRRGLDWLRKQEAQETYSVSMQTAVLTMLSPDADRAMIKRNVDWLEQAQITQGPAAGSWSYGRARGSGDNSNSHFALVALHEADRMGVPVKEEVWTRAQQYWMSCVNGDGSWGYTIGNSGGSGSMTCAGIASVWITAEHLGTPAARTDRDSVACCGGGTSPKVLERGLAWLGKHFTVLENPGSGETWLFYYLYGLERVGRFTGRRFIGEHDWYLEGAKMLVGEQELSGNFRGGRLEDPTMATSFALLFLAKSRRPVIIAKSSHDPNADWNRHGHDIVHLVDHLESRWREEYPAGLSWHVLDTPTATLDDFRQARVLWLSGMNAFDLGPNGGQRLRDYIDEGGFIFAEACCPSSHEFDKRLRALVSEIFPEPDRKLQKVPEEHPVWIMETPVPPEVRRPIEHVKVNGRTCLIYVPPRDLNHPDPLLPSLSCLWELGAKSRTRLPPEISRELEAAFAIGANVIAHALNTSPNPILPLNATLEDLPPSQLAIPDAKAAERITTARKAFDVALKGQRENVRKAIGDAAEHCAKATDLKGLKKWKAAMREFETTYALPDDATPDIDEAYRIAQRTLCGEITKLNECYKQTRDDLTRAQEALDATAVEDERRRFFE